MKVDFDVEILNLEGDPIVYEDEVDGKKITGNLTLSRVCLNALLLTSPQEQVDGEEKFKRYQLAMLAQQAGTQSIEAKQVTLLKDLIGKMYGPLIVGRAWNILEGEE